MQVLITLFRRELSGYLSSITGYVVIAAAAFLTGFSMWWMLIKLSADPQPMPLTEIYYSTLFFWIVLLPAVPIICMRLFALEKFSGTFETLMTTPVTDIQVVLAKFSAAVFFYMLMWLPLLIHLLIIRRYSQGAGAVDAGTVGGTYLGIFLLGCMFISLGCFASAITRNQMLAAIVSLALCLTLFLLNFLTDPLPGVPAWVTTALAQFALLNQMHDFCRGIIDTRAVVFYLSLTLFFLFLTLRAVESRRWR
jgi:ABC-2 type transport system permease protein